MTTLAGVREPGQYYLTSAELNNMNDFPLKNTGGWWLFVSAKDTGETVVQEMRRNSSVTPQVIYRLAYENSVSSWFEIQTRVLG